MSEELKPITERFIEEFLLEAQHRSGLPLLRRVSAYYANVLSMVAAPDSMLNIIMNEFVNNYMKITHMLYHKNKTWKSYDW